MGFKTTALLTTASVLIASAPAFATTFNFTKNNPAGASRAGDISSVTTSFDDNTDLFTWSSTIKRNSNGVLANGAWLVANDGPNPKGVTSELAIYYLDEAAETVSIYNYNGKNNSVSWQNPGQLLDSIKLDVVKNGADEKTYSFSYDATDLNALNLSPNWKGTAFNDKVGLWFHAVSDLNSGYDALTAAQQGDGFKNGKLNAFAYNPKQSWYDVGNQKTEAVPEPATAAALGLFAVAGAFMKRKQSA